MTLDELLRVGQTQTLGSHTFTAKEIKEFAGKYDPQRFHLDEVAARNSIFGGLCASGWHTVSMWMHFYVANYYSETEKAHLAQSPGVRFGPSPGLRKLKWLKPVYVGDTITYKQTPVSHRALTRRPDWHILLLQNEGFNQDCAKVLDFESSALFESPAYDRT
jgi:acyl dehydratase